MPRASTQDTVVVCLLSRDAGQGGFSPLRMRAAQSSA